MDEMEDKLGAILGNPDMMKQIMSMAQSLGQSQPPEQHKEEPPAPPQMSVPDIDPAAIQKIMGFASKSGIDRNEQALLKALSPYLTKQRLSKLEKAMRAAKLAKAASSAIGSGGIPFLSGR